MLFRSYIAYHDHEWGVPCHDETTLFEMLNLEGAQAGLSWSTILKKREGYREAFAGFDPAKVARFTDRRIEKLLTNPAIVRHRQKIASTVTNAQAFLAVQKEFGSFDQYAWQFVGGKPKLNRRRSMADGEDANAIAAGNYPLALELLEKLLVFGESPIKLLGGVSFVFKPAGRAQELIATGVSVGEIYRFLRGWLGHETRVSGEITRSGDGIALTARIGGAGRTAQVATAFAPTLIPIGIAYNVAHNLSSLLV